MSSSGEATVRIRSIASSSAGTISFVPLTRTSSPWRKATHRDSYLSINADNLAARSDRVRAIEEDARHDRFPTCLAALFVVIDPAYLTVEVLDPFFALEIVDEPDLVEGGRPSVHHGRCSRDTIHQIILGVIASITDGNLDVSPFDVCYGLADASSPGNRSRSSSISRFSVSPSFCSRSWWVCVILSKGSLPRIWGRSDGSLMHRSYR